MSAVNDRLRIGDTERERAQAALADHYAAGRLDHDEYSERLDRIWAARTQADLDPVFTDLPGPHPQQARRTAYSSPQQRVPSPPASRRGPRLPVPLLAVLAVLVAVTVVTHLPLILIGFGVWFFFLRGGCRPHSWSHRRF